ncbi:MAG TPA: ribosomal L7Ae/L30e/S12e/Gadd45 family protein [Longimicrobiales bacterium]|nr:ribosomal L7Ae/L30e/S12e/Gadd45 family protein [Longimicrobiales bacterium]
MGATEPVLRLLGLAARAGAVLSGTERVREAARAGALHFVLVADDISANTRDKLIPLLTSRSVPHREVATRAVLGGAVGRPPASALGITDAGLARKLEQLLKAE